jgi:cytochrome c
LNAAKKLPRRIAENPPARAKRQGAIGSHAVASIGRSAAPGDYCAQPVTSPTNARVLVGVRNRWQGLWRRQAEHAMIGCDAAIDALAPKTPLAENSRERSAAGREGGRAGVSLTIGIQTMRKLLTAALCTAAFAGAAFAQNAEKGATVFKRYCSPCHRIGPGAKNLVGPELNGLDGRHSGSAPGYNYSQANEKSGIVWNEQTFKEYIRDPRAKIPGTKMIFAGIKNEQDINDLWAYLKQFDAEGNIKK